MIKKIVHSSKTGKDYDAAVILQPKGSQCATQMEFPKTDQDSKTGGSGNKTSQAGKARR